MKKKIYLLVIGLFSLVSCDKDVLDKAPLDIIADNALWQDSKLIDAYLTAVYADMTILLNETPKTVSEDHDRSEYWNGPFIINEISDEGKANWIMGDFDYKYGNLTESGGLLEWWESAYDINRTLNVFLEQVPDAPVDSDYKEQRIAEARFLRAYNYFAMVKRYGGVPLITTPQSLDAPEVEMFPARDKEEIVYDFILSELEEIVNDLPADTEEGRPNKYAALILKSRAALYAASIADFGEVQLDGIVGINATKATVYYQEAFDAAEEIMNSGIYALYDQDADKVENFKNVFLVQNNVEVIWTVPHATTNLEAGGNGWVWDFFQTPRPQAWGAGNQDAPYLEMAEEFELVDGSSGELDRNVIQTGTWTYEELWANKDPRFFATIWTHGTSWQGRTVDWHYGILLPDGSIQTNGSYQGILAEGYHYKGDSGMGSPTSFGVMKYLDESKDNMGARGTSGTSWIIFRYAEVLLNYAEAAFELGKTAEALDAINQIRNRAGIAPLESIDRESIRHERKIELAFEGHRYWDVRRWRTAVEELTGSFSGLRYILDPSSGEYIIDVIENVDGTVQTPIFRPENYYFPITPDRIANNNNLVENPGY